MKITIIGPSAGGKSVLASKLCERFSIPKLEIDRLWFSCGGEKCVNGCTVEQKNEINAKILTKVEEFMRQNENWITEGTNSKIQQITASQADTVVLIQRPLIARIFSHVFRVLRGKDRHPEVTIWQDLGFVRTMIRRWKKGEDEKMNGLESQFSEKVIVLRSFKKMDDYVKTFHTRDNMSA